jgi:hypothetical protein
MGRTKQWPVVSGQSLAAGNLSLKNHLVERAADQERKISSDDRAARIFKTVHVDSVTPTPAAQSVDLKMPLVASARRFGPAGATAVIAVLLTLAGGIIYGARRWFPAEQATDAASAAPANAATLRPTPAKKSERPHAVDNGEVVAAKTRNFADANAVERNTEKRNVVAPVQSQHERKVVLISPAPQVEKRMVFMKSQTVSNHGQEARGETPRKAGHPVGAPNIRFPNLNFRDDSSTPSSGSPVRSFGSLNSFQKTSANVVPSPNAVPKGTPAAAPKFYRAADGTQIVKFSDGSTQFVRPGERSAQR